MSKLIAVLVVLIGIILGVFFLRKNPNSVASKTSPSTPSTYLKMSTQASLPVKTPLKIQQTKSDPCLGLYKIVTELSVEEFLERYKTFNKQEESCLFTNSYIQNPMETLKVCDAYKKDFNNELLKAECAASFYLYRAQLLAELYRDYDDYKSMELSLLINKILGSFMRNNLLTVDEKAKLKLMTQELINRAPDNLQFLKAHIIMSFLLDEPKAEIFQKNSELNEFVSRALELSPNDEELSELKLFGDSFIEDKKSRFEKIYEFAKRNPSNPIAHYHLAKQYWQNGHKKEAISSLESALKLSPENERFLETLEKAKNPKTDANEKIFTIQFGFKFNEL